MKSSRAAVPYACGTALRLDPEHLARDIVDPHRDAAGAQAAEQAVGDLLQLTLHHVGKARASGARPEAIDVHRLSDLYKQASGECPVIREVKGAPCGQGRFGCWTCTVVRKDRAVQGLVQEGHTNLSPGYWVYVAPYWYIWRDKK